MKRAIAADLSSSDYYQLVTLLDFELATVCYFFHDENAYLMLFLSQYVVALKRFIDV